MSLSMNKNEHITNYERSAKIKNFASSNFLMIYEIKIVTNFWMRGLKYKIWSKILRPNKMRMGITFSQKLWPHKEPSQNVSLKQFYCFSFPRNFSFFLYLLTHWKISRKQPFQHLFQNSNRKKYRTNYDILNLETSSI